MYSFPRMSKLSQPYQWGQKEHKQYRIGRMRLQPSTWLVSLPRSCRNQNGYHMCSCQTLWDSCHRLVKRCSSHSCRGSGYETGLFQLLLQLLSMGHQYLCTKLQRLLRLLHQSNSSRTHVSSALLWCGLKSLLRKIRQN